MFRSAAVAFGIISLLAGSAFAQGNGRNSARNQGIPPGQMPPAGMCRVWYEGRPPGQQPRATNCDDAERVASRSRTARVIYGDNAGYGRNDRYGRDDRYGRNDGWYGQNDRNGRTSRTNGRYESGYAFDQGFRDGVTKAQEDMRDGDRYDPARHGWYKDGDRGYNSRYGTKDEYRASYRSGFVQGYDDTYQTSRTTTTDRRDGRSIWEVITGNDR
jgi:hypothetical protein